MNDQQLQHIDAILQSIDPAGPGLSLAVLCDGKLAYSRSIGLANLDYGVPITSRTAFRVASLSKQFTGMCIALLELEGRLSPNDDIKRYLPEMPDYGTPITIDHLLRHTSGLQDFAHLLWAISGRPFGDAFNQNELLELVARQRQLDFAPGTNHLYSNTGYFLLGVIVERVTGMKLSQFAHERIFAKLGMDDTHFHDDNTVVVPGRAVGYAALPGSAAGFRINDMPTTTLVGDDGLFTTVEDLMLWDANFRHNVLGGGPDLINRVLSPGALAGGEPVLYGYGHFLGQRRGLNRFWHYGDFLSFQSVIRCFPEQALTMICLANSNAISPIDIALAIEDILLADKFGPAPSPQDDEPEAAPSPVPALTAGALAEYEGRYTNDQLRVTYLITSDGTQLMMRNEDPHAVPVPPLAPAGADAFRTTFHQLWGRLIAFNRSGGRITGFTVDNLEQRATAFTRVS